MLGLGFICNARVWLIIPYAHSFTDFTCKMELEEASLDLDLEGEFDEDRDIAMETDPKPGRKNFFLREQSRYLKICIRKG